MRHEAESVMPIIRLPVDPTAGKENRTCGGGEQEPVWSSDENADKG